MTNYREIILDKLRSIYPTAEDKDKIIKMAELVKTTGNEIVLRQLYVKVVRLNNFRAEPIQPKPVKDKTMNFEDANLLFNGAK